MSWNASVQRANIYNPGTTDAGRRKFRDGVITYCREEIIPMYANEVEEDEHCDTLQKLTSHVTGSAESTLLVNTYRIGIAQKLLNLQLKYLWCAGYIPMPPHCPVDRIILSKTRLRDKVNWTQIDSIVSYRDAIDAIMEMAGSEPLAEWELRVFDRRTAVYARSISQS